MALLLAGAALAVYPMGSPARYRLGSASERPGVASRVASLRRRLGRAGRRRCSAAGGIAVGGLLLGLIAPAPALAAAAATGLLVSQLWLARDRRADSNLADAGIELVRGLADELRAGRSAPEALAIVAESSAPAVRAALRSAAHSASLGGDVPTALRVAASGTPSAELPRLAAGWELSQASGCSLAAVLDAVDQDLRDRRGQDRLLAGLLGGPRATAGLLAVLPVIGLAMGSALGADPIRVLTTTGPGQAALLAGVALDILGVLWTARLVRVASG